MTDENIEWLANRLEKSAWLFYGEFEEYLDLWPGRVVRSELRDIAHDTSQPIDFQVAYWSILAELVRLGLIDYGSSPRNAWWTEDGERFRDIVIADCRAIRNAMEFSQIKVNTDARARSVG